MMRIARNTTRRLAVPAAWALAAAMSAPVARADVGAMQVASSSALSPLASPAVAPSAVRPAAPTPAPLPQTPREMVELGARLEHAEGVSRDPARAHELYCAAAREDHADGLLRLGWMYANGRGVARDDGHAHALFRRAADLGSELGARLAGAVRGPAERMPSCMTPPMPGPGPLAADPGPTPIVDAPAEFRAPPSSVDFRKLSATVVQMARDFRLDPRLVFALIRVESGFDPTARSPRNAQGLMQLIPETAERFAVKNVWDPVENLRGGMSYLRWLLSYFKGDVVLTLAAYNAGEKAVDRHRGVPPYPETLAYVQRIRAFYPFDRHAYDRAMMK